RAGPGWWASAVGWGAGGGGGGDGRGAGEPAAEGDEVGRPGRGESGGDPPAAQGLRPPGQPGAPVVLLKGCGHVPARSRRFSLDTRIYKCKNPTCSDLH